MHMTTLSGWPSGSHFTDVVLIQCDGHLVLLDVIVPCAVVAGPRVRIIL